MADDVDPKSPEGIARKWIAELDLSEKWRADYWTRCQKILRRYRNDQSLEARNQTTTDRRYAILWSNIQTLGPAVYARTPIPQVIRRFRDDDPIGRYATEVLERALIYSADAYDFDSRMRLTRDDYLLLALGQVWVRYIPHEPVGPQEQDDEATEDQAEVTDDTQITDEVEGENEPPYAEVQCDHLNYSDWGMQPCREWAETDYVWRCVYMGRKEGTERFGKVFKDVPLDWVPKNQFTRNKEQKERIKKAAIYEIWCKSEGKVFWISKSYNLQPLDERDDWLHLKDFFPCPRPLCGTVTPDSYTPVPDYVQYQDQAEELDELTQRIGTLINALRMVGFYAGEEKTAVSNAFAGTNNTLIPVDSWAMFQDKGGIKGMIEWVPVDQCVAVLNQCTATRTQIIQDIYQITGIADIMRGETDPNETATAQGIKTQWGAMRVRDKQKDMARFARDVLRIKGEIIAQFFSQQTLSAMTDVKLLTAQEKQQIQLKIQLAQRAQQAQLMQAQQGMGGPGGSSGAPPGGSPGLTGGAPPPQQMPAPAPPQPPQIPPELQRLLNLPSWDDVMGLLRSDAMRSFRVDVETDSTIEPNDQEEKERRVEFVTAMGQLIGSSLPAVQEAPQLMPLIGETIKFLARGFRVGREMEDVIDQAIDSIQNMPPKPPAQGSGPTPQELAIKAQEVQSNAQINAAKVQAEQQKTGVQLQIAQAGDALKRDELQLKAFEAQTRAAESMRPQPVER